MFDESRCILYANDNASLQEINETWENLKRAQKERERMAKIITAAVIKGGTGKTSTVAALAQAAHFKKKKVLAVDLDPQANLTAFLAGDDEHAGSLEFLHGAELDETIQTTPQGIDLLSACPDLAAEKTTGGSAKRLERALLPVKEEYDFIFIDTPPQMGELTFNALQCSDGLLIPLEADASSISGLYQVADIAADMKERSAAFLSLYGVILTRYRPRAKINQYIQKEIKAAADDLETPYLGEIRDGIAIREAQTLRKSLFEYAPRSNPAQDYMKLFEQIKRRK